MVERPTLRVKRSILVFCRCARIKILGMRPACYPDWGGEGGRPLESSRKSRIDGHDVYYAVGADTRLEKAAGVYNTRFEGIWCSAGARGAVLCRRGVVLYRKGVVLCLQAATLNWSASVVAGRPWCTKTFTAVPLASQQEQERRRSFPSKDH